MTPLLMLRLLANIQLFGASAPAYADLAEGPRNRKAAFTDSLRARWRCGYCGTSVMRQCAEGRCAVRELERTGRVR